MAKRKPRIELLTPDLNLSVKYVPNYDLLRTDEPFIYAIALALWELSGSNSTLSCSRWRDTQIDESLESIPT